MITDHAKRQEYLDAMNIGGMSRENAVFLMIASLVVPNVLVVVINLI